MPNQSTIKKLIVRIQQSELSPSNIQVAATEILSIKAKEAATELYDVLAHQPGETVVANILALFRDLAIRSPDWVRILDKSVTKKGRCPKPLVATVRQMLSSETDTFASRIRSIRDVLADFEKIDDEPIVQEQVERDRISGVEIEKKIQWFRSGKIRATVPMTIELSDIKHMEALASMLGNMESKPDELCFDFLGLEHVYVVGLAAIKAWCNKRDIVPRVLNVSATTERYLEEIGFTTDSNRHRSALDPSAKHYAMAIEQIVSDSQPDKIASKIVGVVDSQMHISRKTHSGLIVLFAELIENIQRHAGASSTAFACAQVYPYKRKLTICIVDTGMGVRESILSSSNNSLIDRVRQGESPLRLACDPLITSKPDRHSGYGLYVASELIIKNGGTFRIFSGDEIFTCYRKRWQRKENLSIVSNAWDGTWIAMIVDLDGLLPVEDVYSILPAIQGVELQDFFNYG